MGQPNAASLQPLPVVFESACRIALQGVDIEDIEDRISSSLQHLDDAGVLVGIYLELVGWDLRYRGRSRNGYWWGVVESKLNVDIERSSFKKPPHVRIEAGDIISCVQNR